MAGFTITAHTGWEEIHLVTTTGRYVDVYRVTAAGSSILRNGTRASLTGDEWLGNDYEVPLGSLYGYRADVYTAYADTVPVETFSTPVTRMMQVAAPGVPYLSIALAAQDAMPVRVEAMDAVSRESKATAFEVVGRSAPVVVASVRAAQTGTLRLITATLAERDALWRLLDTGQVLLLRTDAAFGFTNLYFAAMTVTEERVSPLGVQPYRRFAIEYVATDPPGGGSVGSATTTWQQVRDGTDTWASLMDERATWREVLDIPYA